MTNAVAYIGLGSNIEDPFTQLNMALKALQKEPSIEILKASPIYLTKAFGPVAQPDFLNACISVKTTLDPFSLLKILQTIELKQGRVRTVRFGPRTLDLDLLLYDNCIINTEYLVLPHPRMHERNTVLLPLLDIEPLLKWPNGSMIAPLLEQVGSKGIQRYARQWE